MSLARFQFSDRLSMGTVTCHTKKYYLDFQIHFTTYMDESLIYITIKFQYFLEG